MPFHSILRHLLQSIPGAIGALFLDREGEAVELWAERPFDIGADGLRAIGAYQGIFLGDIRRICDRLGIGTLHQLTIEFDHAKVLSCDLNDGYYLVLLVDEGTNEGVALQKLRRCREQLNLEI